MPSIYYEKLSSYLDTKNNNIDEITFKNKLLTTYKIKDEGLKERMYLLASELGSSGSYYQILYIFELLYTTLIMEKDG